MTRSLGYQLDWARRVFPDLPSAEVVAGATMLRKRGIEPDLGLIREEAVKYGGLTCLEFAQIVSRP